MELDELDSYIETYNEEIKPRIESGNYNEELITYMTGLVAILSEECIRSTMTIKLDRYLLQSGADAKILLDSLKEKDIYKINKLNKELEVHLRQFRVGLEAKSQ